MTGEAFVQMKIVMIDDEQKYKNSKLLLRKCVTLSLTVFVVLVAESVGAQLRLRKPTTRKRSCYICKHKHRGEQTHVNSLFVMLRSLFAIIVQKV